MVGSERSSRLLKDVKGCDELSHWVSNEKVTEKDIKRRSLKEKTTTKICRNVQVRDLVVTNNNESTRVVDRIPRIRVPRWVWVLKFEKTRFEKVVVNSELRHLSKQRFSVYGITFFRLIRRLTVELSIRIEGSFSLLLRINHYWVKLVY